MAKVHDKILPPGTEGVLDLTVPATWIDQGELNPFFEYSNNNNNNTGTAVNWSRVNDEDMVPVAQELVNQTYKNVTTKDRKDGPLADRFQVTKVLRVENKHLWQQYAKARATIKAKRSHRCTSTEKRGKLLTMTKPYDFMSKVDSDVNEVFLWHGTSPESALSIAKDGFSTDFAGSARGTMYGCGMYFAECSSKSDEYAKCDPNHVMGKNTCCLLLCRVVLGESLVMTTGGDSTYGIVEEAMHSGQYESVLGDREASAGTYREFVTYTLNQAYPEYIVMYERMQEGEERI
jgi:hypothetical protein